MWLCASEHCSNVNELDACNVKEMLSQRSQTIQTPVIKQGWLALVTQRETPRKSQWFVVHGASHGIVTPDSAIFSH